MERALNNQKNIEIEVVTDSESEIQGEHIKLVDELIQLDGDPLLEVGVQTNPEASGGKKKSKRE